MAIEEVYFGKNVRSAMAVGQASGVAMLAAAERGVRCFAYTPQAIKMAVCGSGGAGKKQVQQMVGTLLGLPEPPDPDHAADALAVAICHGGGAGRRAAVRGGDGGARSGWRDDRRGPRRGAGAPARPRRHRRQRRRLQAHGLRGDPEGGARRRAPRPSCTPSSSPATTRSRSSASPARRSATSSASWSRSAASAPRSRSRPSPAAPPASCCGRSPPATRSASRRCPGSASGRRSGSSSSCARRSPARSRRRSSRPLAEGGDARALARDGLVNLGYAPLEAEQLLDGLASDDPQELIASALRKAGTGKAA